MATQKSTNDDSKVTKATETSPAKREVDDGIEYVEFTTEVRGQEVELRIVADLQDAPFDLVLEQEKGNYMNAVTYAIGDRQMAILRSKGCSFRDFQRVMNDIQEAWGVGED